MVRWLIKADEKVVAVDYSSAEKARRKAQQYAEECANQDEPWFPKMTVVEDATD